MTAAQPRQTPLLDTARGALVEQQALIRLRHAAAHLQRWSGRRLAKQSGGHASPFKGRGLSFHHVREYQGGDEIRHIDWRVTARTTTAHTKVFEEEKERPVVLCVDQRSGMFFGSQHCFKSVLACHVMALLGWAALESNDRVGGLIFSDHDHREVRPRRSRRALLKLIHDAVDYNHALAQQARGSDQPVQSLARSLEELRRITRPGSSVFVISDFQGLDDNARRQLHLLARHNDIYAVAISDPMEEQLPGGGHYAVSNGHQRLALNFGRSLRDRFAQRSEQEQQALAHFCRQRRIGHLRLRTDQPYFPNLQRELSLA